jgi:hypothetical protein
MNSGHLWWQFLQCVTWGTPTTPHAPEVFLRSGPHAWAQVSSASEMANSASSLAHLRSRPSHGPIVCAAGWRRVMG